MPSAFDSISNQPNRLRCTRSSTATKMTASRTTASSTSTGVANKPPHQVLRRNERERKRVQQVNMGFVHLRDRVPHPATSKKLSKVETLREAARYIRHLQNLLDGTCDRPFQTLSEQEQHRLANVTAAHLDTSLTPTSLSPVYYQHQHHQQHQQHQQQSGQVDTFVTPHSGLLSPMTVTKLQQQQQQQQHQQQQQQRQQQQHQQNLRQQEQHDCDTNSPFYDCYYFICTPPESNCNENSRFQSPHFVA